MGTMGCGRQGLYANGAGCIVFDIRRAEADHTRMQDTQLVIPQRSGIIEVKPVELVKFEGAFVIDLAAGKE